ncbi:inositol 2-dehydrogenase [Pseudalkalibacillus hwajinpoensis]|uniref:Inositol 2-dehydrogenase n=1 Tax=Guptibacillus hwajinpoensis TaxID=208199 RepID=A0A4U1MJ10_9BACL|nr:inositol 2-dehydrogenase [Pseudalkalibacillus hwajinpoensis]TKD70711.1 inositol 2-dehydrogenase [Pseudalkalibacillus hwajinpoensis]
MEKVNVGIIGGGRIGLLHAANMLQSAHYSLKRITDIYTEHLAGTVYEKEATVSTNPDDIFNDPNIDAIFICSSTDTHVDFIKKAARSGKHIFCEKPISFDIDATREALKVVAEEGVHFQVGFNRRYDKHFRKVYDTVREGKIGKPHVIKITSRDPEAPPEEYIQRSGGMFMDMTIHDFDMVRYLAGSEVVDVTVKAANLVHPKFARHNDVDTAIITLTFADGSLAVIDNSRQAVYGYDQRIEVFGDLGAVSAENEGNTTVRISTKDSIAVEHPKYFFLDRYKEAYIEEINDFALAITEGKSLTCSGVDGLHAEELALAARRSWQEKRTISLAELKPVRN